MTGQFPDGVAILNVRGLPSRRHKKGKKIEKNEGRVLTFYITDAGMRAPISFSGAAGKDSVAAGVRLRRVALVDLQEMFGAGA